MTYLPNRATELILTEYTIASQSLTQNSDVVWDATTKRSTSSTVNHSVSSADITLNGPGAFWLVVSIDCTRTNTAHEFELKFYKNGEEVEDQSPISFLASNTLKTFNLTGFTVVNLPLNGKSVISLRLISSSTITCNADTTLQIWETT